MDIPYFYLIKYENTYFNYISKDNKRRIIGMLKKTNNYNLIIEDVKNIMKIENSYMVKNINGARRRNLLDAGSYSAHGLSTAGTKLGFPAKFVEKYNKMHPDGARKILTDTYGDYFDAIENKKEKADKRMSTSLFVRDFNNKHCAVLTDKYIVFDDNEVTEILSQNSYLMDAEEFWYDVSPERFHARFVSKNKLYVDGDDSPLSMCVFVDNSMCGASSFKIRFGIYRWACTNGLIAGLKEFEIVREPHKGEKDYVEIVAQALEDVERYENIMLETIKEATLTKARIVDLDDELALAYIQKSLNVGKKASEMILENFRAYGGKTKWDMVNAITDYAHAEETSTRINLETKALKVA